uniref:NADP-dependent oxidoreductase domain-containing protein n=1 Tax=Phytophthora ramorum TaxID=164328 RepID=H3G9S3_PHYRM
MTYRFLGNSGLLVSKLALGMWMFLDEKKTADAWYEMMQIAFKNGVNFYDNAEVYGGDGKSEEIMGSAIQKGIADGVWSREDLVVTTKICMGINFEECNPNGQGIGRKHLIEGTRASLRRMQLDYVDVIFCHRPETYTPIEETVRAMNHIIEQGWAFYWGTSEWNAADIVEACEIADRLGLIRPIVEQPQYSLMERSKVEFEFAPLYKKYKLGLTTWAPLANGILTGKYSGGVTEGTRFSSDFFKSVFGGTFDEGVAKADKLKAIADEVGCTLAQLATAWCISNENVSTVLVGASRPSQLEENLKSIAFVQQLTPEVKAHMNEIATFTPQLPKPDPLAAFRGRWL